MRKSLLIGSLLLGASMMLVGFDSSETADSVLEKSDAAVADAQSMSFGLDLNCDIDFQIGDGTITSDLSFLLNTDFTIDMTMDPLAFRIDGSYDFSALGASEPGSLTIYAVPDDTGDMIAYIWMEEEAEDGEEPSGSWYYSKDAVSGLADLFEEGSLFDGTDAAQTNPGFTLSPEAATCNGSECYLLRMSADASMLADLAGEEPDETVSLILDLLDGVVLNVNYYVDTATWQPAEVELDLNDSDLSSLNSVLATLLSEYDSEDAQTSAAIILNDVTLDIPLSFGDVDPITVPQEALDAVADGTATSLDDTAQEAEDEMEDNIQIEENGDSMEAA